MQPLSVKLWAKPLARKISAKRGITPPTIYTPPRPPTVSTLLPALSPQPATELLQHLQCQRVSSQGRGGDGMVTVQHRGMAIYRTDRPIDAGQAAAAQNGFGTDMPDVVVDVLPQLHFTRVAHGRINVTPLPPATPSCSPQVERVPPQGRCPGQSPLPAVPGPGVPGQT